MLEIFYKEFHKWGYIELSRLDKYIRQVFKKTFMTKKIYMSKPDCHINQYLASLVIDKQLSIWNKNNFRKYKKIYPASKAWVFLESEFDFHLPQ